MNDVNVRFLEFCDFLKAGKIVKTSSEFAKSIGVSSSYITEITKSRSNVGVVAIQNSVIKYSLNSDWLLTGKGSMFKTDPAPVLPIERMPEIVTVDSSGRNNIVQLDIQAAAGLPGNLQNAEFFKELPAFTLPGYIYQQGSYIAIQVSGDSMHPTILHCDYLIAKEVDSIKRIRNGYIYVVVTLDSVLCKRVYHTDDASYIEIVSDNDIYPMDTIPLEELQRLYEVDSRLSTNLRNYNSDVRRDVAELKSKMSAIERKLLTL